MPNLHRVAAVTVACALVLPLYSLGHLGIERIPIRRPRSLPVAQDHGKQIIAGLE